jgi:hypothetical protein
VLAAPASQSVVAAPPRELSKPLPGRLVGWCALESASPLLDRIGDRIAAGPLWVARFLSRKRAPLSVSWLLRIIALCFLLLLGTLPLIWIGLLGSPIGDLKYFHLAAALLLSVCVFSARWWWALGEIARRYVVVVLAVGIYLIALAAVDLYHGVSLAPEARQLVYAAIGLTAGAAALVMISDGDFAWRRSFGIALPIVVASCLVSFTISAAANNVPIARAFSTAFSEGDSSVIGFGLFQGLFGDQGLSTEHAGSNLRHEVFAAVLLAALVTTYAWSRAPARSTLHLVGRIVVVVTAAALLVLSLSRALWLAVLLTVIIGALTHLARPPESRRLVMLFVLGAAVLITGTFIGLDQLIWDRLGSSGSYGVRATNLSDALTVGIDDPLTGSGSNAEAHNLVLDAFARGGLIPAAAALTVFAAVLISVAAQSIRRIRADEHSVPIPVIGLAVLVIVRMATSGGGQIYLAEWVALGIYGALLMRERQGAPTERPHRQLPVGAGEERAAPSPLGRVAQLLRVSARASS